MNINCFCKKLFVYDSRKEKSFALSNEIYKRTIFGKFLLRQQFEDILKIFPQNANLNIMYSEFLFEKFQNIHLALLKMSLVSFKYIWPNQRYKCFSILNKIRQYAKKLNASSFKGKLEIESVINIEENLEKVVFSMKKYLRMQIKFWKMLDKNPIFLKEMDNLLTYIMYLYKRLEFLWQPLLTYLNSKREIKYYYLWYLKNIRCQKIKNLELEIRKLEVNEEKESINSNIIDFDNQSENIVFENDSCVIEISAGIKNLGVIINTSKNFSRIFGYQKSEVINLKVNILMPKFFAANHDSYLKQYIVEAKKSASYKEIFTFALHKNGHIFSIWLIVKQIISIDGKLTYMGLIRPLRSKVKEEKGYVLTNELGTILGISQNLASKFETRADFFTDNNVIINISYYTFFE